MSGTPVTDPHASPTRILLVSPEENFSRTVSRVLKRCGYGIDVVGTGELAFDRALTVRFDVIVSQVTLPGSMSGVVLLRALRDRGVDVPFVLLAEKETNRVRNALETISHVTALPKDAHLDSLKSILAECLGSP